MELRVKLRWICASLVAASLFTAAPILRAQDSKKTEEKAEALSAESRNWPVKVFQLRYANARQLGSVFKTFGAIINADPGFNVLVVRAPKEVLAAIEESVQRLDVPQPPTKNIQIDTYLLIASAQGSSGTIPADLEPVVKQLKSIFNYKTFRILGALSMRMRDDSDGTVSGLLPPVSADSVEPTSYRFHINKAAITSEGKERALRINGLELRMAYSLKGPPRGEAYINTSVDVHEGQKVVVGKANIDNADNALILVLTAKVIE
jgi:Bacterial type II/III secretion system short domain